MGVRRLLTGPVGPGSTFSVLALAEEAGRAGRRHALVLPTRPAMEHARNELARRTGSCDPRTVFTFAGLARHLLGASHPRPATHREKDALLVATLRGLSGPERDLALRFRGFRQSLISVFDEVEHAGLATASALQAALRRGRLDEPRAERLVGAYQGWREALGKARLSTEAELLHLAAQAIARGRVAAPLPELLLVDGFTDLTHRQQELLGALALRVDDCVVTCPVADPDAPTGAFAGPDRLRAELRERLGFVEAPREVSPDPRPPALRRIATHLFAKRDAPRASDGATIEPDDAAVAAAPAVTSAPLDDAQGLNVVRAASRRDEVEVALARAREFVCADPARRWTDVLLVVPDVRRYRRTLEQVGRELGVPVRVRGPLPLSGAPIVQAAMAFVRAAATLELPPLLVAASSPVFGLEPDEADRLGRAARRQGLPMTGDPLPWQALAAELGGEAGAFVERTLQLGLALRRAMARDPSTATGCGLVRAALERALRPVAPALLDARPEPEAVAEAAAEVAARRELLDLLADLERLAIPLDAPEAPRADDDVDDDLPEPLAARLGTTRAPRAVPSQLANRIDEEVRATEITPVDRRRHVLHAVDLREARAWEADLVLVLGLVEGEVPRSGRDDLFLPEGTRRALTGRRAQGRAGVHLRTAQHRAAEEAFLFYAAATRARRELWLVYPGFSPSGTPRHPSRFVEDARALFTDAAWEAALRRRTPSDLVADEEALLLTRGALRRFAYRRVAQVSRAAGPEAEKVRLAVAMLDALFDDAAELARAAVALSRPDPVVRRPLGGRALERVYSASELEAYATCPYQHFVKHLLGARREDDLAQQGLDARRQGIVIHKALEYVYSRGDTVEDAFEAAFLEGARALDIGIEEDAFRRQALANIRAFVSDDDPSFRRRTGISPLDSELRFGPRAPKGPLVIEAPELGGEVRLEGSIDRVDVAPPLAAPADPDGHEDAPAPRPRGFVTDYKIGGREVDARYLDGMHQGERLQIPVYLLALERVFGMEPIGAAFAALGTRRRTGIVDPALGTTWNAALSDDRRVKLQRVPIKPTLRRAEEHIKRIVAGIAQGIIEPAPRDASECTRCDARDVCRLEPWEARRRARRGRALPALVPPARSGPPAAPAPAHG